jgi:hypothetical protein
MAHGMRFLIIALTSVLLASCAATDGGRFPSLAIRPGERIAGTIEPAVSTPPPPATAATGSKLADLRAAALAAHQRFGQRRERADALSAAARGSAVAGEARSVAQVALAELDSARSEAMVALADLDSLYVSAADAAVPTAGSGDLDAIRATRSEVAGWVALEDGAISALRARLRE